MTGKTKQETGTKNLFKRKARTKIKPKPPQNKTRTKMNPK
jgi:hypothetical protein